MNAVSVELFHLRKSLDQKRRTYLKKDRSFCVMQKEITIINDIKVKKIPEIDSVHLRVKKLEDQIERIRRLVDCEENSKLAYFHMLDRMKNTVFYLEKKQAEYREIKVAQKSYLTSEINKSEKSKEARLQSKTAYSKYRTSIVYSQKEQLDVKTEIHQAAENLDKAQARRENVKKRQKEFLDNANIRDQISQLVDKYESVKLFKFYYHLSSYQFEKELQIYEKLEESFSKMRQATGLTDIDAMIERFLTKEHGYRELVSIFDQKEISKKNILIKLNAIEADIAANQHAKTDENEMNCDEKRKEVQRLRKGLKILREQKYNLQKIGNKVRLWTQKTTKKIQDESNNGFFITGLDTEEASTCKGFLIKIKFEVRKAFRNLEKSKETIPKLLNDLRSKGLSTIIEEIPLNMYKSLQTEERINPGDLDGYQSPIIEKSQRRESRKLSFSQFSSRSFRL